MEAVGFSEISTTIHDVLSQKAVLLKRRNCFEGVGFDGRVILKWIYGNKVLGCDLD
jgi:hypothetical protein